MQEFNLLTGKEMRPQGSMPYQKPDEVLYSEDLQRNYQSTLGTWRSQAIEDRDFVAGAQWDKRKEKLVKLRGQTPLTVDCTSPAFEQAVAMLTFNNPSFSATGSEDSDVRIARLFADVMGHVWYTNNGRMKLKQVIKDYYTTGVGWFLVHWDPLADSGRGDIVLRYIDPMDVFTDTSATDFFFSNAAHIVIASVRSTEDMQARLPMLADYFNVMEDCAKDALLPSSVRTSQIGSGSTNRPGSTMVKHVMELDRYSRVKVKMFVLRHEESGYERSVYPDDLDNFLKNNAYAVRTSKAGTEYFFDPASVRDAQKTISELTNEFHIAVNQETGEQAFKPGPVGNDEEGFMSVPGSDTTLYLGSFAEALAEKVLDLQEYMADRIKRVYSVGGVLIYSGLIEVSDYPLIPCVNNFDNSVAPVSDIRRIRGLQEYINDLHTLVVAHAESTTNFKVGYPEGAYSETRLRQLWNRPGTTFIPFASEIGELKPLMPAPLPNELYKNIEEAKRDIERILGIYVLMQGDPSAAPNTYKGTVAIDEYGQRRIRSKKDDIEAFLTQLGKVVVQFMQSYYTNYRVIRLRKPNGEPGDVLALNTNKLAVPEDLTLGNEYRINDVTTGKIDVRVVAGSTLPSNRWALLELYMELYKLGIVDDIEVLKKTDVADQESVLQRKSMIVKLQQELQAMQEENKRLKGDLQTAQRESVSDRKRVMVMNFEKEVSKAKEEIRAATELYTVRLQDELKMRKERNNQRKKR